MEHFTNTELADMYLIYGLAEENARAAGRLYYDRYSQKEAPYHRMFSICSTISVDRDHYEVISIVSAGHE